MADERSEVLRSALETFSEPMVLWRPDGKVAFANRRFLEAFSVERDEVEGAEQAALEAALVRKGAGPATASPVAALTAPGGRQFERRSRPLPGGGRMETFLDLAQDKESAARREELLGVATHDLRSPLANVRSYASLLLGGRMADQLDPRVKRSAEVIARNADRALKLLQAYFDSMRAETGQWDVDRQPNDLLQMLGDAIGSRRPTAAEKGIELVTALPPTAPQLLMDRERVGNAVGAFLDNALARSRPPAKVELLCEIRPSEVFIGVADEGDPLSPEDSRRAFDRDSQILKERRLGLGFSVAVARAVVAAHGGKVGVNSAPGRTVFFLTVPR